jgi:hypothetical protein
VVVPAAVVLALAGAALARYNQRVTGSPATMPQQVAWATYRTANQFIWLPARPAPAYNNEQMREFYAWELDAHRRARSPVGYLRRLAGNARIAIVFYLGPALLLPLVMLPWVVRDRRFRPLLVTGALVVLALTQEVWLYPHYAAPMAAVIFATVVQCLRHLRVVRWRGRPVGRALARAIPAVALLMVAVRTVAGGALTRELWDTDPVTWYWTGPGNVKRARLLSRLAAEPGTHLAIVRYSPRHDVHLEWVYNGADVDGSKVVWARDRGAAANDSLLRYFRNRRAWLVEPDERVGRERTQITPYPGG